MDIKRVIANNIYILRMTYNLTQQEFADKLGTKYSRSLISNTEQGNSVPSAEFIRDVSESFNVSINWILDAHNNNYPNSELTNEEVAFTLKIRNLPFQAKEVLNNLVDYMTNNK